jgi:hypothetical protein
MNGVLYEGVVISARHSADGESPTIIYVTKEANGSAIWRTSYEEGTVILEHQAYGNQNDMIEKAVLMVVAERKMAPKATP